MQYILKGVSKYILIFILICSVNILPQETAETDTAKESYSHAIQFYLINQVIVAYKYHITEPSAFRITLNVTGLFNEEDGQSEMRTQIDTFLTDDNYEHSKQLTEVKLHYLYNIKANNVIGLFLGAGPLFNYAYTVDNYNNNGNSEKIWNIGISALAGLECVVYRNISLFAEYEATFAWGRHEVNADDYNIKYKNDTRGYELVGIRAGLSIYF